ncbi:MAG: hypothetical protein LKG27_05640 [Clostridiaceae bacterium]|jgi:hypothetical protein|nr:hypothetical protein [Clostridiaceae bacterium]
MKKYLFLLCVMAICTPCMAKQNYSYTMRNTAKQEPVQVENVNSYSNSTVNYTIKSTPNSQRQTKISESTPNVQGEKISQVGSILYYDSGNKNSWKNTSRITGAAAAIGTIAALDPYVITINGNDYIMVRGMNKTFVKQNIIGLNDDYNNIFSSLKEFDTNNDGSITGWELKSSNVRLARLDNNTVYYNDRTKDYNVLYIKSIETASMRTQVPSWMKVENRNSQVKINRPGTYGTFDVQLANNLICPGKVEFISKLAINNMVKGNK